jgi:hypothetical protein
MNETEHQKEEETTTVAPPETVEAEVVSDTVTDTPVETTSDETVVDEESTTEQVSPSQEGETEATAAPSESEAEPVAETETAVTTTAVASAKAALGKSKDFLKRKKYTVATLVLVLLALVALMYALEEKGKLNTGLFDGVQKQVSKHTAAATVNNAKISNYDLSMSVTQLTSGAAAQGADVADPAVQTEIKTQALEMLINTELLKQEAANRGISVSEEDVNTRLETLKTDVGGEEVLNERMAEFGINKKTLLRDIKNELTIQKLLDEVFKEKSVAVTEEEIVAFYDQAGGAEAGLPGLDEVRTQIETQLKATKEQGVVTAYIEELRGKATIETLI